MLAGEADMGYIDLVIVDINSKEIPLRVSHLDSSDALRLLDVRFFLS
jgi:hypothetical protein